MKPSRRNRSFVVFIFFLFILLHQSDKLLIGPLTTDIIAEFGISDTQMGAVFSTALIIGSVLYPVWGYLYDRYARAKLVALASLIWGATTWLSALAPTFTTFLVTRASTGIDDSSYPGVYSLISDYYGPEKRGRIFGALQIALPLGYLVGLVLALLLAPAIGWRSIFYITGSLGILLSLLIFFTVKEAPRGQAEPECADLVDYDTFKFDWQVAKDLFKKRTLWLLFAQGFAGVFPWNVISFWFFAYLERERLYGDTEILTTMAPAVLMLAAGYFIGGTTGDAVFKRNKRGRLLVAMSAVLLGAIFLNYTLNVPVDQKTMFFLGLLGTALFIPFASPNVVSTVHDIPPPEVRSTALSIQYFIENGGAALAPLLAGYLSEQTGSLGTSILVICVSAWIIGAIFLAGAAYLIPKDIDTLRTEMQQRADALAAHADA